MDIPQILALIESLDGTVVIAPGPGSEAPEIAWGDYFFSYAPEGQAAAGQPFATIVTKDYPDDTASDLDGECRWRLNIHVGRARLAELTGEPGAAEEIDHTAADVFLPHPVYGSLGWVSVVLPGRRTSTTADQLLRAAHAAAVARAQRRDSAS